MIKLSFNSYFKEIISRVQLILKVRFLLTIGRILGLYAAIIFLDKSEFTNIALAISIVEILKVLFDFGLEPYVFLKIGKNDKKINQGWRLVVHNKVVFSIIGAIITIIFSLYLSNINLLIASVLLVTGTLATVLQSYLHKQKFFSTTPHEALLYLTIILLYVFILMGQSQGYVYIGAMVVYEIIVVLMLTIKSKIFHNNRELFLFKVKYLNRIVYSVYSSRFNYAMVLIGTLVTRMDAVIIRPFLGQDAQYIFSTAFRATDPLMQVFGAVITGIMIKTVSNKKVEIVDFIQKVAHSKKFKIIQRLVNILALCVVLFLSFLIISNEKSEINILLVLFVAIMPMRILCSLVTIAHMRMNNIAYPLKGSIVLMIFCLIIPLFIKNSLSLYLIFLLYIVGEYLNFKYQIYHLINVNQKKNRI
mgnify:FL=1